jgi:gliding motility-associated lipoprotein GldD
MRHLCYLLLFSFLFTACGEEALPVPKPRSYPRVNYPVQEYELAKNDYCSFSFEKPVSSSMVKEDTFFEEVPPDSCWFDLRFDEALNGSVHFSYYPVDSYETFEELRDEAFKLMNVHNKRASDIQEIAIHRDDADVHGVAFDIAGAAASPFQFFLTDSTNHFLRGALYFDAEVRPDSLAPIIAYAKEDIFRMVETFKWEE